MMKLFDHLRHSVVASLLLCGLMMASEIGHAEQVSDMPTSAEQARKSEWAIPIEKSQNLFQITPTFFRSAQLKRSDVALLKKLKIKTVVNLRSFHSDKDELKDSGIQIKRVRINTWDINDANVTKALRTIVEAEKQGPVLLHCWHGADRTGLISAMYRMVYMGWSKEQAVDELRNGNYGYHSVWKNILTYLNDVDVEKIKKQLNQ